MLRLILLQQTETLSTSCQFEVLICEIDGISMLQSLMATSTYRLARATQIAQLTLSTQQITVNVLKMHFHKQWKRHLRMLLNDSSSATRIND
jgi:hypothetical protein